MAIIGTQIAAKWFKPFEDDDAEYFIQPLRNSVYADVILTHSDVVTGVVSGTGLLTAFIAGVKDWKQVFNEDGKEAVLSATAVEMLDRKHFYKVANEVLDISFLGADEVKNS
tara:strand:- start:5780 stop:6115 length:336 start_codon:yes stop_codon:yes gene_type:complete